MTTPDTHEGLRPLSPHGEGYCATCRFIVGLDASGRLDQHSRGTGYYANVRTPCKGSGGKPPKRTPYMSRKSVFRVIVPDVRCPACEKDVQPQRYNGGPVYSRHGGDGNLCPKSGRDIV